MFFVNKFTHLLTQKFFLYESTTIILTVIHQHKVNSYKSLFYWSTVNIFSFEMTLHAEQIKFIIVKN